MNRAFSTAFAALLCAVSADAMAAGQWSESRDEARSERSRQADYGERSRDRNRGRSQQQDRAEQGGWNAPSRSADRYSGSRSSGPSGFQGVAVEPRADTRRHNGGGNSNRDHSGRGHDSDWRRDHGRDNRYGRSDQRGRGDHDRYDGRRDYRSDHRNDYRHDYDRGRHDNKHYRYSNHRSDWRHSDWRRHWSHGWSGTRYRAPVRYYYPSGYHRSHWRIGYNLPLAFLISSYYVDYGYYGLAAPPYGCRWLRVDGDLLLVELASGAIVDVLYDFYY
ncbi:RcnB family protein [Pseudomarimonas arenosa]|uniref:RcnB family protein n=1 Tax=Pseudomarimonas arenosa TaxID=2774145 RepID=A0AAW3ZMM4_9GAMM|nr:RcnB family protein [Pseudomarimonas arenosa]MBD8526730.1 RcnB family protein [Pseudomarimonas arenosa]